MRGGTIVTTFFFSLIFLKMKAKKNQIAGSALAFLGVLIVGITSLVYSKNSSSDTVK
jgi:drug/metabolite transporter (DMT)-like permease